MTTQFAARRHTVQPPAIAAGLGLLACGGLILLYAKLLLLRWAEPQALDDFAAFWVAGRLAAAGHAAAAYDWVELNRQIGALFGGPAPHYLRTFFYPPPIFLVVAPLARLPFAVAAALWLGATLAAFLAACVAILRRRWAPIAALAAPVVLFNFSTGQNGLLTAGLIGGALAWLDERPAISGVLIGLCIYKPHFGVLLPFYLAATGRWRVFAAAAATIAVLAAASGLMFGWQCLAAFAEASPAAVDGYLQHDRLTHVVAWGDLESVYGLLRALGVGAAAAVAVHILAATAAIALCWQLARRAAPPALQMAGLATAMVFLTPYSELNDVAILMVPLAFLVRDALSRGASAAEKAALATAYLLPLLYLPGRALAKALGAPPTFGWAGIGPLLGALLIALLWLRQWRSQPAVAAG